MEENKNHQYYVVEFTDPPYTDFDKYVCVPGSWMVLREVETQTSIVKYPVERISITKKRVKKKESFVNDWFVFDANVKFGTNSYKNAKDYIKALNKVLIQERGYAKVVKNGNEPSTSGIETRKSQLDRTVNEVMTSGKNGDSSIRTASPQPSTSKMSSNCNLTDSNISNKFVDSNSVDNKRYFTRQSHQSQLANSKALPFTLSSFKQKNLENESDNRDKTIKKKHVNLEFKSGKANREFFFDHDLLVAWRHLKLLFDIERDSAENFVIKCKKYARTLEIMIELIENCNSSNCPDYHQAQIMNATAAMLQMEDNEKEKVMQSHEKTNDVASPKPEEKSEINKKAVTKNQKGEGKGDVDDDDVDDDVDDDDEDDDSDDEDYDNNDVYHDDDDDDDEDEDDDSDDEDYDNNDVYHDDDIDIDDDDDESHHHQKHHHSVKDKGKGKSLVKNCEKQSQSNGQSTVLKKRRISRKFTLPPDYDKNDSRWTLRYHEIDENLVELIPHSNVYVNSFKLKNCKRLSKDSKTLARKLLVEIFTESALSTCSLTGKKANAFAVDKTIIRPGLDEHARNVLLNYVENHAMKNQWVKLDTQSILNSLRNKIQEMRYKHG